MPNIIKTIVLGIESAYTKSQKTIQRLLDCRGEKSLKWETEINEHIRIIERSETDSRMDGRQTCGKNDSGNSSTSINGPPRP